MESVRKFNGNTPLMKPSMERLHAVIAATRNKSEGVYAVLDNAEMSAVVRYSAVIDRAEADIKVRGYVTKETWRWANSEINAIEVDYVAALEKAKADWEIEFSRMARRIKTGIHGVTK